MSVPARLTRTLPLVILLGLLAPPSAASPPPARSTPAKAPSKAAPPRKPVRKQLDLSAQARERLSRPTVERAPVKHVPFSKKDVRARVSADARPQRKVGGRVKRVSNAELTAELNTIEKKLNTQGYSLRGGNKVVYHEHRPDRAALDKQVRAIRKVAEVKPPRKPLTKSELRARVRREAKPVRSSGRPPARAAGAANQYWSPPGPGLTALASHDWSQVIGESWNAAAYLSTHASFGVDTGGLSPGMYGNVSVSAGAYILGDRYEAFRLDGDLTSPLDGQLEAALEVTLMGGFRQPLIDDDDEQGLAFERSKTLYDSEITYGTSILLAGFPVSIDVIVTPKLSIAYGAELRPGIVLADVQPNVRLEATVEAYLDYWLASAGAGGNAVLLDAKPKFNGAAYLQEIDGALKAVAHLYGAVTTRFLEGRVYAFFELGWCPFCVELEWELMNYDGWGWSTPLFEVEISN